jgi:hypothetical protein
VRVLGPKSYDVTVVLCKPHRVDDHYVHLLTRVMRTVESRAKWIKKASNAYEVLVRISA